MRRGTPSDLSSGVLFHRPDRFPYTTEHLGRRVAWVVGELRRIPSPLCRSCAVDFEDRLADEQDAHGLLSALGHLERGMDRTLRDHRAEIKYVRIHLRKRPGTDQVVQFLRGYRGN